VSLVVVVVGRGALRRVTIVLGRIQRLEVEGEDEEKRDRVELHVEC
jgi:hypothetical protein